MSSSKTVLVVAATGQQGSATLRHLQQLGGFTIRGLTRNPDSPAARKLVNSGVLLFKGDMFDKASLVAALKDVACAFFITDARNPQGVEGDVIQGNTFISACEEAGVKHVVYSSVNSPDRCDGTVIFECKLRVEKPLQEAGFKWTIIRPVCFMENLPLRGFGRWFLLGMWAAVLQGRKVQMVSTEGIGAVAAKALAAPDEFHGKTIELAGDELTVGEMQAAFARATGERVWKAWIPRWIAMRLVP